MATLLHPVARFGARPEKSALTPRVEVHAALRTDASGALNGQVSLLPAAWSIAAANMRFSGQSALALRLDGLDLGRHRGQVAAKLSSSGVTAGDTTRRTPIALGRAFSRSTSTPR